MIYILKKSTAKKKRKKINQPNEKKTNPLQRRACISHEYVIEHVIYEKFSCTSLHFWLFFPPVWFYGCDFDFYDLLMDW